MTDVIEKRLLAVEQENRDLRGRLDAMQILLSGSKPAPPRRHDEPTVKISHPMGRVELPSDDECRRLCATVWQRYPKLRPGRGEEQEFISGFIAAFRFVQHHGRRAEPDRQHSLGFWIDSTRAWASQNRISSFPISGAAFAVAIVAAGDVPYTNPEEPGFVCGLQFGGGGSPSKDWWRRALAGTILEPTPPLYPTAAPSPARARRL
jgi:hypothetical protein